MDRVPDELWNEVHDTVQETGIKTIPIEKECKSRKSGVTGKFDLGAKNEAEQRLTEFCQENTLVIANTLFQQHKRRLYTHRHHQMVNTKIRLIVFAAKDGEALYSQQK